MPPELSVRALPLIPWPGKGQGLRPFNLSTFMPPSVKQIILSIKAFINNPVALMKISITSLITEEYLQVHRS